MGEDANAAATTSVDGCPMARAVKSIVYWRTPLSSAIIFGLLLALEFSFIFLSALSISGYIGLSFLVVVNVMRLYYHFVAKSKKNIISEYLGQEFSISRERTEKVSGRLVDELNHLILRLRDVFLLINPISSAKVACVLYLLTYVGARFNFLTLCILGTLLIFTLPKFYEAYKPEIDKVGTVMMAKFRQLCNKIPKAARN